MARILIVYESKHGQTEKIAKFIRDRMAVQGHAVELFNAEHALPVAFSNYDGVIVGAPIYARRYPRRIRRWVEDHSENLNRKQSAFFSVCMAVLNKDERTQRDLLRTAEFFFEQTGWYPKRRKLFAGAVAFTKYNWFVKWIAKAISNSYGQSLDMQHDHEFTPWRDVARFCDDFVRSVAAKKPDGELHA